MRSFFVKDFVVEVVIEEDDVIVGAEIFVAVFGSKVEADLFRIDRFSQPFEKELHVSRMNRVVDGQVLPVEGEREPGVFRMELGFVLATNSPLARFFQFAPGAAATGK